MIPFVLRRLGHGALVLLVVSVVTFGIMAASPGGPSLLADPKLSVAERAAIAERLGLDQPVPVQYLRWLGRAVRGDLGHSFLYQTPTLATIGARLPNTLLLAGTALLGCLLVGIPLGISSGARPGSAVDRLVTTTSVALMSMPTFWLGIVLILGFAVWLQVLPAGGATTDGGDGSVADRARHLVLPATVLAAGGLAELVRYTRSATRTALDAPYLLVARARGIPRPRLIWRHAARNTLVTITSIVGLQLPRLFGGAAITEMVFSWPGMGRLAVEAALSRDYPLVMGVTMVVSAAVVLASLLVDVVQVAIDPRIRAT